MFFQLLLLLILLVCSAFFSGTETALFALSRYELAQFRHSSHAAHRLVAELLARPRRLLLTLMIGNVTINTFIFALSLSLFEELGGQYATWAPVLGLIAPITVTLFGEILPKGTAIVLRNQFAGPAAPLVRMFQLAISPISLVLNSLLVEPMTRLLTGGRRADEDVSVEELEELLHMSEKRRVIDADENAMLSGVIRMDELHVRDVMVHRVDVVAFNLQDDPEQLRAMMREKRFPKLPVCDGDLDHVVGVIYGRDLFLQPDKSIRELVKPVRYVPEQITLTQLLQHFRRTGTQLAMVIDEYGGIVGLVTIEDVAEPIVGELTYPGEEENEPTWAQLDPLRYRVWGGVNVREWAEQFQVRPLDERVTTLAGLVIDRLGHVPAVGDQVRFANLIITVESLQGRRIEWLLVEFDVGGVSEKRGDAGKGGA